MNILFIYTNIDTFNQKHLPHGLASLVSVLKRANHRVELLYLQDEPDRDEFIEKISRYSFDLVGISTTTSQWHVIRPYPQWIKRHCKSARIILGGTHPTLCPDEAIALKGVDMICVGEGERPLVGLCDAMAQGGDISRIPGIWLKKKGVVSDKIIRNEPAPLFEDLDAIPFPDRDVFHYRDMLLNHGYEGYEQEATLKKGRGCAYHCTYCANASLRRLYRGKGPYVRTRSVSNVMAELGFLRDTYPEIRSFHFEDDTFTINRQWVHAFCDEYRNRIRLPFRIYINPLSVDFEMLRRLKEAGLYEVSIGVECGNEAFRKQVLKRNISNRRLARVFHWLHDLAIRPFALVMMGFPGETRELIQESMDLIKDLVPFHTQIVVYYPYPATPLYDLCKERGLLTRRTKTTIFRGESTIKLENMSARDFAMLHDEFWRLSAQMRDKWFRPMEEKGKDTGKTRAKAAGSP